MERISCFYLGLFSILMFGMNFQGMNASDDPNIFQKCFNIASSQGCLNITKGAECGVDFSFSLNGENVISQHVPKIVDSICQDISKQVGPCSSIHACADFNYKGDNQRCLSIKGSCGFIPIPETEIGCFSDNIFDDVKNCDEPPPSPSCLQDQNCIHGQCRSDVCMCNTGYYGWDCSSTTPQWETCVSVNPSLPHVCGKLKVENCMLRVEASMGILVQEFDLVPLHQFAQVFQDDNFCINAFGCGMCIEWKNLVLNETMISGCLGLGGKCQDQSISYSPFCFEDQSVVAKCLGECPGYCSFRGSCSKGMCHCDSGYEGADCSQVSTPITSCPNNCGGQSHGNCIGGVCQCLNGWNGEDCSQPASNKPTVIENGSNVNLAAVFIPIGLVIALGIGCGVFWYVRKKKSDPRAFVQLELDDEQNRI